MVEIVRTNKKYREFKRYFEPIGQLRMVDYWMTHEDAEVIDGLHLDEAVCLFCFIRFVLEEDYFSDVTDRMEAVMADGVETTAGLCDTFNAQMGKKIIRF